MINNFAIEFEYKIKQLIHKCQNNFDKFMIFEYMSFDTIL